MPKRSPQSVETKRRNGPSLLEWIAGGIGAALTLATLAAIGFEAFDPQADVPPQLEVRPSALVKRGDNYVLEATVFNHAQRAAAAVAIEGVAKSADGMVETSSATIDHVPGESERTAGLLFGRDPRAGTMRLRVLGYQQP